MLKVRAGVASKELEQRPSVKLVALVKLLLSPTFYAKIFLSLFYLWYIVQILCQKRCMVY